MAENRHLSHPQMIKSKRLKSKLRHMTPHVETVDVPITICRMRTNPVNEDESGN